MIDIDNNIPLLATIIGGKLLGTLTPESDLDVRGVYLPNIDSYYGYEEKPKESISYIKDGNDVTMYSLDYFLRLLEKSNPAMVELVMSPHVEFDTYQLLDELKSVVIKNCSSRILFYAHLDSAGANIRNASKLYYDNNFHKYAKYVLYIVRSLLLAKQASEGIVSGISKPISDLLYYDKELADIYAAALSAKLIPMLQLTNVLDALENKYQTFKTLNPVVTGDSKEIKEYLNNLSISIKKDLYTI